MISLQRSWQRSWAMVIRNWYQLKKDASRTMPMLYWPIMNLALYSFSIKRLNVPFQEANLLLTGLLLWEFTIRGAFDISLATLEEFVDESIENICMSPIQPWELIVANLTLSALSRMLIMPALFLFMYAAFHTNPFVHGLFLIPAIVCFMLFGWAIGLFNMAKLFAHGRRAMPFIYIGVWAIAPFSGVYSSIEQLPSLMQKVAKFIPTTYAVTFLSTHDISVIMQGIALSCLYIVLSVASVYLAFSYRRKKGLSRI